MKALLLEALSNIVDVVPGILILLIIIGSIFAGVWLDSKLDRKHKSCCCCHHVCWKEEER